MHQPTKIIKTFIEIVHNNIILLFKIKQQGQSQRH